jgi:IS5 family transposase
MTADQVLRAALLKQMESWTYDELHFHLLDSLTYRGFTGLGWADPVPGRSTLQRNIKRITEATWEAVNRTLLARAKKERVEDGRKIRVDATVTETNIHAPTDSSLLWDGVRVLTRQLAHAREDFGVGRFPSRARRAKRRAMDMANAKNRRKRTKVPRQAAFDGGYASKANLRDAKAAGVEDVSFSKKRGLEVLDMARSQRVYKRLRDFRAGIESWISFLKRFFGVDRCWWRGAAAFPRYVGASMVAIVAANLLTLARHLA